jgi:hypothetical protein
MIYELHSFRYRLKMNLSNDFDNIGFLMYDDVVKKFAPLTYIELENKVSLFLNFVHYICSNYLFWFP